MHRIWKRLDQPGLEFAHIVPTKDGFTVRSSLIDGGPAPFAMVYTWTLSPEWRTRSLDIAHADGTRSLMIERKGDAVWRVDGRDAPHLDGCREIDVSATPFCNTLAISLLGGDGELAAAYVEASTLETMPSRQRYERLGEKLWRYHDLGVAKGFTADLKIDRDGLVSHYEGLFEALR
jgi:hypothetical protein